MTLRTRLLIGYALLVLLLVATGAAGSYEFREISILVNDRLDHFTATTKSANTLLRSVDRQDRALLHSIIAPDRKADIEEAQAAHEEFLAALERAEKLADEEQRALLDRIRAAESEFVAARDLAFRPTDSPETTSARMYDLEFRPALKRIREPCEELFGTSRSRMFDARDAVRDAARDGSVLLGVLVTVGLLSLIALARSMRTHVLERLAELRRFSEAISSGEEYQRALISGNDELSRLAAQMNTMLDHKAALEGRLEGRLAQDRLLLVGMLEAFGDGAILMSTSGDLIAWAGGMPHPEVVDGLALLASERNHLHASADPGATERVEPMEWSAPDGSAWRLHRLLSRKGRASGWLAEPVE